ncbi:MAG: 16S rRNA (guanine(966)-N(2))-methyltransferase RsmD [Desulfocapsaceae bacterium]|nr:16S rRNA (guanine(966)-N(2))-methyltransferase RsmD [Desulfocapsaceae bacterium]
MRIISGKGKGRKLFTPPVREVIIRPTSDRAREAIFNIIADRVLGASVLDLFAGTGALGIEALSRGAQNVCFVDFHPQALDLISRNIQVCMNALSQHPDAHNAAPADTHMDTPSPVTLIKHDLRRGLPYFSKKIQSPPGFDLIFLDPPYSQGLTIQLLSAIDTSSLLRQHTLLIVEERAKETLPERLTRLTQVDQRKYGEAGFWFYQPLPDQTT